MVLKKAIIFSASIGMGHKIAALSLRDLLIKVTNNKPLIKDAISRSKFPYSIFDKIYYFLEYHPRLWKSLYYLSNNQYYNKFIKIQNYFLKQAVANTIKKYNPEIVFCTHPFYIPILEELRPKQNFKFIAVITDFGNLHQAWFYGGSYLLWVPSNFSKKEIIKRLDFKKNYSVLGYPVRKGFWNVNKKKKHILILFSRRNNNFKTIFNILREIKIKQIYVSPNPSVRTYLIRNKKRKKLNHIRVIGFTYNIHNLMRDAICVISKPGGSTVAECNFLEKPILAINPLPAQEEGNVAFIEKTNSGVLIDDLSKLENFVNMVIERKIKFRFKEKLRNYYKKQINFLKSLLL